MSYEVYKVNCDQIKQSTITLAKEMTEVAFVDDAEHQPHHQMAVGGAAIISATTINAFGGSIIVTCNNNGLKSEQ